MHTDAPQPCPPPASDTVIDVADGLDRIMGDRELYQRMLQRFRPDYDAGTAPMTAALDAADRTLAHRLTHTLMGAAGMIGARALHAQAAVTERAIRTSTGDERAQLALLAPQLTRALHAIDALLDTMPAPAPARARELVDDATLLKQLEQLLERDDGAVIDLLDASGASLRAVLGERVLAQVLAATHDFDFGRALGVLRDAGHGAAAA